MAVRTSLTWIKRRIHKAILQLADREGWGVDQFEFTGTFDEQSGQFRFLFGSVLDLDHLDTYQKILAALRAAFEDHPAVVYNVSLVIEKVDRLEEVFQNLMIAEDEIDLGDLRTLSA